MVRWCQDSKFFCNYSEITSGSSYVQQLNGLIPSNYRYGRTEELYQKCTSVSLGNRGFSISFWFFLFVFRVNHYHHLGKILLLSWGDKPIWQMEAALGNNKPARRTKPSKLHPGLSENSASLNPLAFPLDIADLGHLGAIFPIFEETSIPNRPNHPTGSVAITTSKFPQMVRSYGPSYLPFKS